MADEECDVATNVVDMIDQLMNARPINIQERQRVKRQLEIALSAFGILLGGYNTFEIQKISTEVNQNKMRQQHILSAIKGLTNALEDVDKKEEMMDQEIRTLKRHQSIMTIETKIIQVLALSLSCMQSMRRHLERMQSAVFSALNQQLSPHLLTADALQQSLASLANVASNKGYAPITPLSAHLFELPVSLYRATDGNTISVFIHVPLYESGHTIDLYERSPLPFPITDDLKLSEDKNTIASVWSIPPSDELVGRDEKLSITSLRRRELDKCTQVAGTYYCKNLIQRRSTSDDSCEVALFRRQPDRIKALCDVHLQTIPETVVSIDDRNVYIYLEEQQIDIRCHLPDGSTTEDHPRASGLIQLRLTEGADCNVNINHHEWRMDGYLETSIRPKVDPMDIDVEEIIGISITAVTKYAKDTELEPFVHIPMRQIHDDIAKAENDEIQKYVVFTIIGVIIIVLTCILFIYCYLGKMKRIQRSIAEHLQLKRKSRSLSKWYQHWIKKKEVDEFLRQEAAEEANDLNEPPIPIPRTRSQTMGRPTSYNPDYNPNTAAITYPSAPLMQAPLVLPPMPASSSTTVELARVYNLVPLFPLVSEGRSVDSDMVQAAIKLVQQGNTPRTLNFVDDGQLLGDLAGLVSVSPERRYVVINEQRVAMP